MATFTPTQGRYLAFINAYATKHGFPPAESEIAAAMCVSPPSVNQMVKMLERRGLISRSPGEPRSIRIIIPPEEIPAWNSHGKTSSKAPAAGRAPRTTPVVASSPANLYVLTVFIRGGPLGEKFAGKEISRTIEIRGDQTLEQLHEAIFKAYDRFDAHMYEFQFGKRPFDPEGPDYGIAFPDEERKNYGDARKTTLDDLSLKQGRVFGYLFDFGDEWFHQVQLERIEPAILTVAYPRVIKKVGKSPPQYPDEE